MKICYLGENISVHNQKWIRALSKQENVDLHVITPDRGVKFENVHYYYLKEYTGTKLDYILNIPWLRSMIKQIQPDLLHAHYASSYGYMASNSNFHPFIITGWGSDIFDSTKNIVLKEMVKWALDKADALTVLSQITLEKIKTLTKKNIELIPFGVDTSKFIPSEKRNDGIIRIGTIRTLSPKYGVEYLIRAFAELVPKHSNIRLEIVGDGELRESLFNLTNELGVNEFVTFHGYVNQETEFEKYSSIVSQLDIFAILSIMDSETFGVAAVEAAAFSIPVVATSVGGLPEVVKDGLTGILVQPKNVSQTANALGKLIIDEELRKRMGEEGRKNVLEKYDWEKSISKMMNLYNKVIKA
jgi:glycosyltransferase involved in cell wall biosynthesis